MMQWRSPYCPLVLFWSFGVAFAVFFCSCSARYRGNKCGRTLEYRLLVWHLTGPVWCSVDPDLIEICIYFTYSVILRASIFDI